LGGEVWAIYVLRIENTAKFITGKAIKFSIIGIQSGSQDDAVLFIPFEG